MEYQADRCIKVASDADPPFEEPRSSHRFQSFEGNQLRHWLPALRNGEMLTGGDLREEYREARLGFAYADDFRRHASID